MKLRASFSLLMNLLSHDKTRKLVTCQNITATGKTGSHAFGSNHDKPSRRDTKNSISKTKLKIGIKA
jgi:hypothetical protein